MYGSVSLSVCTHVFVYVDTYHDLFYQHADTYASIIIMAGIYSTSITSAFFVPTYVMPKHYAIYDCVLIWISEVVAWSMLTKNCHLYIDFKTMHSHT